MNRTNLFLIPAFLGLSVLFGFTACGTIQKLQGKIDGAVTTQDIAGTCVAIKTAEDGILFAAADPRFNQTAAFHSAVAVAKAVVPHTQPTCNAIPQPTHIPDAQWADLKATAEKLLAAKLSLKQ